MEHFKLSKLPNWAWIVAISGGLFLFWWNQRGSNSSSSDNTAAPAVIQGSINTQTPQCQQYPLPQCGSTQTLVWTQDTLGCPMPQCQDNSTGSGQPDQFVITDGRMSFSQAQYVYRCWGDARIRTWISLHGYPALATHDLFTALPAGIKLKVCGSF
jgi:hypothetical protein